MQQTFEFLEQELNTTVTSRSPIGGGDFAAAFHVHLDTGQQLFVKIHKNPPPFFFSTEAAGLQWLAKGPVPVPKVLLVSDEPPLLALEWIGAGSNYSLSKSQSGSGEATFGRHMAQLHQLDFDQFGRPDGRTTGSLALPNTTKKSWPEFFANCRLLPLAKLCSDRNTVSKSSVQCVERIAQRLHEWGAADEAPALLHGDLWAGNRMVDQQGQSWLIDPAAHGGHREFDLAMMRLFGGFGEDCFSAYHEVFPLQPGWQQRVHLHQLAPLLVHAIKFGGHYVDAVDEVIAEFV